MDIQEGSALWVQIQRVREYGSRANYSPQRMREGFVLNASDVDILTQFAIQGDNLTKLGWDLSQPETWRGIQWVYANNEHHVQVIFIDNLELTGELNLIGMSQLTRVSCNNNNLSSINVSGNDRLVALFARNSGIHNLNISNTPVLTVVDVDDNYLSIIDIIDEMYIIKLRENAWVSYMVQKLPFDFALTMPNRMFDAATRSMVLNTIQFSAEGILPESIFIEVINHNSRGVIYIGSETIILDVFGVGTYSLNEAPLSIGANGEYAVISVYTDSRRIQLVTRLTVRQALIVF